MAPIQCQTIKLFSEVQCTQCPKSLKSTEAGKLSHPLGGYASGQTSGDANSSPCWGGCCFRERASPLTPNVWVTPSPVPISTQLAQLNRNRHVEDFPFLMSIILAVNVLMVIVLLLIIVMYQHCHHIIMIIINIITLIQICVCVRVLEGGIPTHHCCNNTEISSLCSAVSPVDW